MANEPTFLVIDGYRRDGREALAAGGATPAGELYEQMLKRCHPGCRVDVIYPADPGVSLPSGAALESYDGLAWTGSSLTVYADDPAVTPQIELARAAFEAQVPSFGSCWAAQIGVVAAGAYADLLIVDGNPLEDLGAVTDPDNLRIIMKDGVIYKNTLN